MQIGRAAQAGDRACERARVRVVEAGTVQRGPVPRNVRHPALVDHSGVEGRLPERRMRLAEGDQALHEAQHLLVSRRQRPVEPARRIVLVVRVVVAALRAPDLVAREEHRHAARQQQNREEVLHLPRAQRLNGGIVDVNQGHGSVRALNTVHNAARQQSEEA